MTSSFISKRCSSRFAVVQALFQWQYTGLPAGEICNEFLTHYLEESWYPGNIFPEARFFKKLFTQVTSKTDEIDAAITSALKSGWSLKKLDPLLLALLRAATYELKFTSLAQATIINAYVDLTHFFLCPAEVGFLNAALQTLANKKESLAAASPKAEITLDDTLPSFSADQPEVHPEGYSKIPPHSPLEAG